MIPENHRNDFWRSSRASRAFQITAVQVPVVLAARVGCSLFRNETGNYVVPAEAEKSNPLTSPYKRLSSTKGTIIILLALKGYELFFETKFREDLQRKDTIYISQQRVFK